MQYVVFGANGFIGSYIYGKLKEERFNVTGTSRKNQNIDGMVFYDIQSDSIGSIMANINDDDRAAMICIAEPNIDRCFENYSLSYEINVTAAKRLIHELCEERFHIIYFSSDNVFDGKGGNYTEESQTHALNKYGMMKAEMERYLLANEPEVCIFRIPKVVSTTREKQNIFAEWTDRISVGNIRCIRGNRLSFVCVDDVYHACLLAAEKKLHGLYNIAGDKDYSRAELAQKFYEQLGITGMDIQECDLDEFPFKDNRPLNISMSNLKFKNETGYQFKGMEAVIKEYIENLKGCR